jgi:hypothetical protein
MIDKQIGQPHIDFPASWAKPAMLQVGKADYTVRDS